MPNRNLIASTEIAELVPSKTETLAPVNALEEPAIICGLSNATKSVAVDDTNRLPGDR